MCGIAGALIRGEPELARARVERMVAALIHRGPDGGGVAAAGGACVGMRRLRIRSAPNAALPFALPDGARAAYNGEVYAADGGAPEGGAGEAAALAAPGWRGADGMYALALLDGEGGVRLSRDRFGIKPLFVREEAAATSFASELPALLAAGGPVEIDRSALHELLAFGRTLDRRTLYRGVRELAPGEAVELAPDGTTRGRERRPPEAPDAAAIDDGELRAAVREAVARTLISDRPVGLALSGGLDSSIVAHELKALGVADLRTYSLSLPDNRDGLDGLGDLGLGGDPVSAGWRHTATPIDEAGYFAALAEAARRMGEPFRMSSLPLYHALGRAARAGDSTVLLLGEGADELFGGYESYRGFAPAGADADPVAAIRGFYLGGAGGGYARGLIGDTATDALDARLAAAARPLAAGRAPKQALLAVERLVSLEPLLRRADHALMASGIEGRTPFLHGRLPDVAAALPEADLWSDAETKIALRRAYRDVLPEAFVTAPKRALRAPGRLWREGGVAMLDAFARHGRGLIAQLGLREDGVAAIRAGCAAGDPAAIPPAVALISTGACLADLAERERLADPDLARAARAAGAAFSAPAEAVRA